MKRILRKGIHPKKWVGKCSYCDCEFEYTREDVVTDILVDYVPFVSCPSCKVYIRHSDQSLCSIDKVDTMKL